MAIEVKVTLEKTFPKLKESKDKKDILCSNSEYDKDMLGAIKYCIKNNRPLEKEHLAWLERQGGQKFIDKVCDIISNKK